MIYRKFPSRIVGIQLRRQRIVWVRHFINYDQIILLRRWSGNGNWWGMVPLQWVKQRQTWCKDDTFCETILELDPLNHYTPRQYLEWRNATPSTAKIDLCNTHKAVPVPNPSSWVSHWIWNANIRVVLHLVRFGGPEPVMPGRWKVDMSEGNLYKGGSNAAPRHFMDLYNVCSFKAWVCGFSTLQTEVLFYYLASSSSCAAVWQ